MLALISWIPVIGSIASGVADYFKGKQDLAAKIDKDDVDVIRARTLLLSDLRDDIGIRAMRDFAMFFPIAYVNMFIWDRSVENWLGPAWVFNVKTLNLPWETYLPVMAVYAFLFGLSFRGPRK